MQARLCRWEGTEANQSSLSASFKCRLVGMCTALWPEISNGKGKNPNLREIEPLLTEEDWKLSSV